MSIPIKITPPNDSDQPKKAVGPTQDDTSSRAKTTAPNTDDGSKKPFKEVLEATMADKTLPKQPIKVTQAKKNTDDDDEVVSLLDLAAQSGVQSSGKSKPSITQTAVFHQPVDEVDDVSVDDDEAPASALNTEEKPQASPKGLEVARDHVPEKLREKFVEKEASLPKEVEKDKDETKVKSSDDISPKVAFHDMKAPVVDAKNVIGQAATPQVAAAIQSAPPPHEVSNARHVMMQLAKAMVDQIQLVKTPGRVDTTITLKYPGIFDGMKVKVSEFDTAHKQFNVTFGDIANPTARALIEQKDNQLRLQQLLIDRGYTVQMITIEQKIPGLNSTETGDVALGRQGYGPQDEAGSATDQHEGNVT